MGMESVFKLSVVMSMIDKMSSPMKGAADKVTGTTGKLEAALGKAQKAGTVIGGIGAGVTSACLATVASTFDTQDALGELASLGVEDLAAVESAAKSFSDTWAGTTKSQFISASYDIKSGIASLSDEGVAQMTELAALTGKATKSTTEEMSSLFATGYGIYKGAYEDMSDLEFGEMFSAGISTAVKNYKTAGSEMASAISALGATATNNKVSMEEQLAILGQLQTTMSGSEAATKYKSFLNQAAAAGDKLKLSFVDSNNQLLSTPQILEKLKSKYGDTIDAVEKQQIKEAFGTDEAVAMIDLLYNDIGGLTSGIDSMAASMKQGKSATDQMASAIQNTPAQKFETLKQKVHNTVEELGGSLLPVASDVLDKVSGLIQKFSEWVENNRELVSTIMNIAARLGPVLIAIGGVISAVVGIVRVVQTVRTAITGIKTAITGVKTAMTLLNGTFLASPVTWIVLAIIGLVAAFVILWNKCEAFRNFWKKVWEGVKVAVQPALSIIKAIVALFKGDFSGAAEHLKGAVQGIKNIFTNVFNALPAPVRNGLNKIKGFFGSIMGAAKEAASQRLSAIRSAYQQAGGGIKGVMAGALAGIKSGFQSNLSAIDRITGGRLSALKDKFATKMNEAREKVRGAIEKIKGFFKFSWSLPKLKMPHFKKEGKFSLNPPSVPKISVDWYAKGGVMTKPTVFGASGSSLLAGGEAGPEAVLPLSALWTKLGAFIRAAFEDEPHDRDDQNTWSSVIRRETRMVERKDSSSIETRQEKRSGSRHTTIIQKLELKIDVNNLKGLQTVFKLIDELKDAQNSTDEPVLAE